MMLARSVAAARHFGGRVARWSATAAPTKPAPPPNTVTVTVDGKSIIVDKNMTVLQACEAAGAQIPRFCYHPRLSIAGNCRMCLVEVVKSPKPVASCAMPLMPGMVIKTDTPLVRKAREGVMEFLLANHPLDCPICDQGGECDLQDLSLNYGSDRGRFREWKRTVEDKNMGPFVKSIMTRCIHCTRCVRFADEIAGVPDLGATGRGQSMEIGTYFEKPFDSELSGNVFDLCPVGALTSKPFAFQARPWELQKTESIDVHDGLGCAIRIDTRGEQVMRVLPRVNEDINEEWISDRSRFAYDGLRLQRLDTPMIRNSDGILTACTWNEAFSAIKREFDQLKTGADVRALVGNLADAESMICLKDWINSLGSTDIDCRHANDTLTSADLRSSYIFNSKIVGIEQADFILMIGTNLRMEAPVLNARIRRCQAESGLPATASIGPKFLDVTNGCDQLGDDASILTAIASGSHPVSKELASAKRPMIIIGQSVLQRDDVNGFHSAIKQIGAKVAPSLFTDDWNGINVLQLTASQTAGLDLGLVPGPISSIAPKIVYLLGADDFTSKQVPENSFVVYQGHHGDAGAARANVILPSTAYTETTGTYVNTEGRPQVTSAASTPIGFARPDWQILRALSEVIKPSRHLPYNSIEAVRKRLCEVAPHFAHVDTIEARTLNPWALGVPEIAGAISGKIAPAITNFFNVNVVARASQNLTRAQSDLKNSTNSYVN